MSYMKQDASLKEFQALAEFRYLLRGYLNQTEEVCNAVKLEPQHYAVLLQLVGLPEGQLPTIGYVAKRLYLHHHSAVELIDRMEKRNLIRRVRSIVDKRFVEVHVTPNAKALLKRLVDHRIKQLTVLGPEFVRALGILVARKNGKRAGAANRKSDVAA
jgi:DNA-binding MarR family transcriptional regulator